MNTTDLKNILDDTGLSYQSDKEIHFVNWLLKGGLSIQIAICSDENSEWINLISKVDNYETYKDSSLAILLLRINNKIKGSKFTLNKDYDLYCNTEIYYQNFNSEVLKIMMIQMVKAIEFFYEEVQQQKT